MQITATQRADAEKFVAPCPWSGLAAERRTEAERAVRVYAEIQNDADATPVLRAIRALPKHVSPEVYALIAGALANQIAASNMAHMPTAQAAIEFLDDASAAIVEAA